MCAHWTAQHNDYIKWFCLSLALSSILHSFLPIFHELKPTRAFTLIIEHFEHIQIWRIQPLFCSWQAETHFECGDSLQMHIHIACIQKYPFRIAGGDWLYRIYIYLVSVSQCARATQSPLSCCIWLWFSCVCVFVFWLWLSTSTLEFFTFSLQTNSLFYIQHLAITFLHSFSNPQQYSTSSSAQFWYLPFLRLPVRLHDYEVL